MTYNNYYFYLKLTDSNNFNTPVEGSNQDDELYQVSSIVSTGYLILHF